METVYSSKTSVGFQWTVWLYIPQDRTIQRLHFYKCKSNNIVLPHHVPLLVWHRPVARQRPRNKQLYNSPCQVTALKTTAVARQLLSSDHSVTPSDTNATIALEHRNTGTAFSTRSMPRCYKQGQLFVIVSWLVGQSVKELLRFSRCEMLLLESGSCGRGPFGNPEEGERPPSKAATKQKKWLCTFVCACVCVTVICKMQSRAVSKSPIIPVIKPKPTYSH
jgi:hypothetical protein